MLGSPRTFRLAKNVEGAASRVIKHFILSP